MAESIFTLEYDFETSNAWIAPRFRAIPFQLSDLQVSDSVWTEIYDYAESLIERVNARSDEIKDLRAKLAKKPSTWSFISRRAKTAPCVARDAIQKYENENAKEWKDLLAMSEERLESFGISVSVMIEVRTNRPFGIEFKCPANATPTNDILELRFDKRRDALNLPRCKIPAEIFATGAPPSAWYNIWDSTRNAVEKSKRRQKLARELEMQKRKARPDPICSGLDRYAQKQVCDYVDRASRCVADKAKYYADDARDWGVLEMQARELFSPYGVSVSIIPDESGSTLRSLGLKFQRQPHSFAVPVAAVAAQTSATDVTSLPACVAIEAGDEELLSKLERLGNLYERGILNETEFNAAKRAIIPGL